jgi:hypothetical protein
VDTLGEDCGLSVSNIEKTRVALGTYEASKGRERGRTSMSSVESLLPALTVEEARDRIRLSKRGMWGALKEWCPHRPT